MCERESREWGFCVRENIREGGELIGRKENGARKMGGDGARPFFLLGLLQLNLKSKIPTSLLMFI